MSDVSVKFLVLKVNLKKIVNFNWESFKFKFSVVNSSIYKWNENINEGY